MDTIKFWSVFTIGVAAGAGVALICAPQSGEETRKQLKSKFDDASGYVKDKAGDLGDQASTLYGKGKSAASDLSDQASSLYGKGRSAASDAIDDLSSKAQDAVDQAKANA